VRNEASVEDAPGRSVPRETLNPRSNVMRKLVVAVTVFAVTVLTPVAAWASICPKRYG